MAKRKKPNRRIEPVFDIFGKSRGAPHVRADTRNAPTKKRRTSRKKAKKPRGFVSRFIGKSIYWSLVAGVWISLAGFAVIAWHAMKLPNTSIWAIPDRPPNARIISVDGKLIANRGVTGGAATSLSEMSPYIPMAVIAIEDRRFKYHFGVDPIGLARAMTRNVMSGRLVQGGSTLTQQLAKNLFLKPERTLERKIQEAILAVWMETRFSKDEILELYLNRVYFGSGAYGVDAAARRYFQKPARDVNLAEAAILAGLLKAPSRLSPARNPKLAKQRSQLVLAAMRREGFVSDRETATALTMQAKKAKRYWSGSEHYVADMVMKKAKLLVGEMRSDLIIDTTIDIDLQQKAGQLIRDALDKNGEKKHVGQGALVSLDGTGAIRALVGGHEYAKSQFNRAIDAKRQPGSAFKPFVYLAALEAGRTPRSVRNDAPVKIGKWTPKNYDKKYRGKVTLTTALSKSLNTIAAQLVMESGPRTVIKLAHRLGIKSKLQNNASIALGTSETSLLELTSAYAPFANGGYRADPFIIKRIKTLDGKILYERKYGTSEKVVGSRELGMMNAMLRETLENGTGKNARLKGWQAAGKTGTSQKSRDGWFVGYTANLTTGIWFGNDDGAPMKKVTGGGLPARTWGKYMAFAHNNVPVAELPGNYQQQLAITPTSRPTVRVGTKKVKTVTRPNDGKPVNIIAKRQLTSGIRPSADLGQKRQKPRTILDLIFGKK